ncbi:hypothetical protein Tco_0089951 [Tanacetum coccineum]
MKAICISVHHEGTFTYDPLIICRRDVDDLKVRFGEKPIYAIDIKEMSRNRCLFPCQLAKVDKPKSSSSRNGDDSSVDDKYKVKEGFSYPVHNPNLPWNEMAPLLGMRFEYPGQLKGELLTAMKRFEQPEVFPRLWTVARQHHAKFSKRNGMGYTTNLCSGVLQHLHYVCGSSIWVKSANPPPLPPKKRIMPEMVADITESEIAALAIMNEAKKEEARRKGC